MKFFSVRGETEHKKLVLNLASNRNCFRAELLWQVVKRLPSIFVNQVPLAVSFGRTAKEVDYLTPFNFGN